MHRISRLISPIAPTALAPRAGLVLLFLLGGFLTLEAKTTFGLAPLSHQSAATDQDADGNLGNHFSHDQLPPEGTLWLRRYDRDSADGKRRAGTVYVHVNRVTAAAIGDALTLLSETPADPSKGYADLDVKADPTKAPGLGRFTYLFLGADPARVQRIVQAWDTFPFLSRRPEDKKPGQVIIQRNSRFTYELGVMPQGLHVQVWAGDVPREAVLEALNELMAMAPHAGIPQEIRRQIPPGTGTGDRISLDLVDKDPLELWSELDTAIRKGQH